MPIEDGAPNPQGLYGALQLKLKSWLSREHSDRKLVVLALFLLLPSIDTGLAADDYIHSLMARGGGELRGFVRAPLDLFRFTLGPETELLQRDGVLAWWDDPQAKLAFLRPVSSATHLLDHALWNDSPWLMHLHSLLWSAAALFAVLAVYRALLGPGLVCALAIGLYALDDARGWFGSWIAARNAVIATALSALAFLIYLRAREHKSMGRAVISALVLLIALLAGEGSVAIVGYLFAHALILDRAPWREKLLALTPHAAVLIAWRVLYRALGYGAQRSGLYFDPIGDPIGYAYAFSQRAPILLFAQLGGSWSDAWSALFAFPNLHLLLVTVSMIAIVAVGYALWPLIRSDAVTRFAVLGSLLALFPASTAFSADRLLTWVAIGASLALAKLIAANWTTPELLRTSTRRVKLIPLLMLWLVVDHAIIEPLFLPSRARGNLAMRNILDRAQAGVPSDPTIAQKRVIYINPAAMPLAGYVPIERAALGIPRAEFQVLLATADSEVRVTRNGPQTLLVQPRGGFLLSPPSRLFCGRLRQFHPGERVTVGPVEFEVKTVTADARPSLIEARFDRVLEDPIFVWRQWLDTTFVPFTPPPLGKSVVLPAADWLRVTLGDAARLAIDGRLPAPVDPTF